MERGTHTRHGHIASLHQALLRRSSDAQRTLLSLQRQYGNRYVRRGVTRARERNAEGDERIGPVLQRAAAADAPSGADGCQIQPPAKDRRAIFDSARLLSQELTGDCRLNNAFHNNPPLTARDSAGTVQKLQQALLDAGEKLPRFGADGNWGTETTRAVESFQAKNGIAPGGFEAGRQTLGALDSQLQQNPPAPPPPSPTPSGTATLEPRCGAEAGTLKVTGTGFPPGTVILSMDGVAGNAALADAKGVLSVTFWDVKEGPHVVEASSGSVKAAADFNCRGSSPPGPTPVDPAFVTQTELLVLTRYQFVAETERDAVEDVIRDLKGQFDETPVPWYRTLLRGVGLTVLQLVYGGWEQLIRNAVKNAFPKGFSQDDIGVVDSAQDKALDCIEDVSALDALKKAFEVEDNAPTKKMGEQLEIFRRGLLAQLRVGSLKTQTDWINKIKSNPVTAQITPVELQALATSLDDTADKLYKLRYSKILESWSSYLAQQTLGGKTEPGAPGYVTNLTRVGNSKPEKVPGVLLIGLIGDGGSKSLPDARAEGREDETVHMNQNDVHIHGMSEEARKKLALLKPELSKLNMPVVLRGEPRTGGLVAIGRDEAGRILDAGSDAKGKAWLVSVGQMRRLDPQLSDPDLGAQAVFEQDLSAADIEQNIEG